MPSPRTVAATAVAALALVACAETPVDHSAHHAAAAPSAAGGSPGMMVKMDEQMKQMSAMHDKMKQAKNADERNALMGEHMKLMQDGMAMMGGMDSGAMGGKPGMGERPAMPADMPMRQQNMDQRMDMMQMMMQMMMDRMPAPPAAQAKP